MTDSKNFRGKTDIVVFGRRVVMEAIQQPSVSVHAVRMDNGDRTPFSKELRSLCRTAGIEFERVHWRDVESWSRAGRHDQGVAARVTLENVQSVEEWATTLVGKRAASPARVLALDAITNPQNVGMIIRSVLASGLDGVLWPLEGVPWLDGLVMKSSAATALRCPIFTCETIGDGLDVLCSRGFGVFGLDADTSRGRVHSIFEHTSPHRACYVVGSETEGISSETRDRMESAIAIPMANGVESLNASIAASIVSFACGHAQSTPNGP